MLSHMEKFLLLLLLLLLLFLRPPPHFETQGGGYVEEGEGEGGENSAYVKA